jgi:hypothetical protein
VDSIEDIQRDYLKSQEAGLNAFNRLLAWRAPVIPVAMQVQVQRVEDVSHAETDRP